MLDDLRNVGTEMRWRKPEGLQRMNHGEMEKREDKKDEKKKRKGVNGVTFRYYFFTFSS